MKHLKTFENISNLKDPSKAEVNDYVICNDIAEGEESENVRNFIQNNIGQILNISINKKHKNIPALTKYVIKYENIPDNLSHEFNPNTKARLMYDDEIKYCSSNKETLDTILQQNKFNL